MGNTSNDGERVAMEVRKITKFEDLITYMNNIASKRDWSAAWYRGHANSSGVDRGLRPSVFRIQGMTRELESTMTAEFLQGARFRHTPCPDSGAYGEWLCLMRHHNLPTRLLDWTRSLLVALLFAVRGKRRNEEEKDGVNSCIWVLHPGKLNYYLGNCREKDQVFLLDVGESSLMAAAAFNASIEVDPEEEVIATLPAEVNLRVALQQATFTVHANPRDLESYECAGNFLEKWVIEGNACRERLRVDLLDLGITESSVFPDLEHLAADILELARRRIENAEAREED